MPYCAPDFLSQSGYKWGANLYHKFWQQNAASYINAVYDLIVRIFPVLCRINGQFTVFYKKLIKKFRTKSFLNYNVF